MLIAALSYSKFENRSAATGRVSSKI